jgi:hypothetical protein
MSAKTTGQLRSQAYAMLDEADRRDAVAELESRRPALNEAIEQARTAVADAEQALKAASDRATRDAERLAEVRGLVLSLADEETDEDALSPFEVVDRRAKRESAAAVARDFEGRAVASARAKDAAESSLQAAHSALADAEAELLALGEAIESDPLSAADNARGRYLARECWGILTRYEQGADEDPGDVKEARLMASVVLGVAGMGAVVRDETFRALRKMPPDLLFRAIGQGTLTPEVPSLGLSASAVAAEQLRAAPQIMPADSVEANAQIGAGQP